VSTSRVGDVIVVTIAAMPVVIITTDVARRIGEHRPFAVHPQFGFEGFVVVERESTAIVEGRPRPPLVVVARGSIELEVGHL